MTDRQIFDSHRTQIEETLRKFLEQSQGLNGEELLKLKILENTVLADIVFHQRRQLDMMAGLPVEPFEHKVEAVLIGVFGGGPA